MRGGLFALGFSFLFFAFLFGPLAIMVVTAFNSSPFPRITPWECFTTDWFGALLADQRLMSGLWTSAIIAVGVVTLSVPLGLAGAIALSELGPRMRGALYTVLITPILVPGVVIGLSTVILWRRIAEGMPEGAGDLVYNGWFMTMAGQISFIASYAMLIFLARLQRFDTTLTEAALDLGASPGQAFRKILLPFLAPAIGSAAFLTLLASFENYNTTVFTILAGNTFTTALASKVRLGTDPSLSALAVIIISVTLVGALVHEAHVRRREEQLSGRVRRSVLQANAVTRALLHPLGVFAVLAAGVALVVWLGMRHDSSVCEAAVLEEKRAIQERLQQEMEERARQQQTAPAAGASSAPAPSAFGGAFAPGALRPGATPEAGGDTTPAPTPTPAPSPFGGAFSPDALRPRPDPADGQAPGPSGAAPTNRAPSAFGGAFSPDALRPGGAPAPAAPAPPGE